MTIPSRSPIPAAMPSEVKGSRLTASSTLPSASPALSWARCNASGLDRTRQRIDILANRRQMRGDSFHFLFESDMVRHFGVLGAHHVLLGSGSFCTYELKVSICSAINICRITILHAPIKRSAEGSRLDRFLEGREVGAGRAAASGHRHQAIASQSIKVAGKRERE